METRRVVVRATIDYVVDVPIEWDAEMINFHRNEGSWCAGNGISEMSDLVDRLEDKDSCLCHLLGYEFLREATEKDIADNALPSPPK